MEATTEASSQAQNEEEFVWNQNMMCSKSNIKIVSSSDETDSDIAWVKQHHDTICLSNAS